MQMPDDAAGLARKIVDTEIEIEAGPELRTAGTACRRRDPWKLG